MNKKVKITVAAIAVVIALACTLIYALPPRAIVKNADLFNIHKVEYVTVNDNYIDITTQVDLNKLKNIIAKYQCRRTKIRFSSYSISLVDYEISGIYNNKPLHIILGDFNVVYESSDRGGHQIENSAALALEIDKLIGR